MNKLGFILGASALVLAMTSCNNDNDEQQIAPSKYITVSTRIGSLTRVATATDGTQKFVKDDQISIYAWTGANTAVSNLVVNNSINTFNGTTWSAAPQMLWKDMVTPHFFIGVYPKRAITDFAADPFTLDIAKQGDADLLVANVLGEGRTAEGTNGGVVPLTFNHVMSKLVINMNFRNQWATAPTVEKVTVPATAKATVNYLTATATATGTDALESLTIPALASANTDYAKSYASVMVPQTIHNIVVTIDGKTYTYTNAAGFSLKKGTIQTVNLIVGRNQIELGSVTISDWATDKPIDGGEALGD